MCCTTSGSSICIVVSRASGFLAALYHHGCIVTAIKCFFVLSQFLLLQKRHFQEISEWVAILRSCSILISRQCRVIIVTKFARDTFVCCFHLKSCLADYSARNVSSNKPLRESEGYRERDQVFEATVWALISITANTEEDWDTRLRSIDP